MNILKSSKNPYCTQPYNFVILHLSSFLLKTFEELFRVIVVVAKLGTSSFTKQLLYKLHMQLFFFPFLSYGKKKFFSFVQVIGYHILQRREVD
jgi:hypothetical protein